jgi:hypothetical protein
MSLSGLTLFSLASSETTALYFAMKDGKGKWEVLGSQLHHYHTLAA